MKHHSALWLAGGILLVAACAPATSSLAPAPTAAPVATAKPVGAAPVSGATPGPAMTPTPAVDAFATRVALAELTRTPPLNVAAGATVVAVVVPTVAAAGAATGPLVVDMGDDFYEPSAVRVKVGEPITWANKGAEAHDVRATDGSYFSPLLGVGETWTFSFSQPGTYNYFCTPHGIGMSGTLVVE